MFKTHRKAARQQWHSGVVQRVRHPQSAGKRAEALRLERLRPCAVHQPGVHFATDPCPGGMGFQRRAHVWRNGCRIAVPRFGDALAHFVRPADVRSGRVVLANVLGWIPPHGGRHDRQRDGIQAVPAQGHVPLPVVLRTPPPRFYSVRSGGFTFYELFAVRSCLRLAKASTTGPK